MNLLLKEIKSFSKNNWWIYIIFILCIAIIGYTNTGNIFEITIVFFLHFLWDLFVMMMVYYFSTNELKKWLFFQCLQFLVFWLVGIYAGITSGKWHYLISHLWFLLPPIKGYFLLFKNKLLSFLNWKFSIGINIFVIFLDYHFGLFSHIPQIIQILWFSIFSIWLILESEKYKFFTSMLWIGFITLGSCIIVWESFHIGTIKGVDVSYALLPLTVFVFYLKNIKKYLW